jgi:hypothetical protein
MSFAERGDKLVQHEAIQWPIQAAHEPDQASYLQQVSENEYVQIVHNV